ncbi:hypothetical protein M1N92_05070 [Dehalococcoidia bacterium]|nr:hypothetical protein [Dehalococcoidia bacterium]
MLNQRLHTNYIGNSERNQAAHQRSAGDIVLIENDDLTDHELLVFILEQIEQIWESQAHHYAQIKKTNEMLLGIQEALEHMGPDPCDLTNIENILREILELMRRHDERSDDDRWPPRRSPKKSKKGGSYVRIQP